MTIIYVYMYDEVYDCFRDFKYQSFIIYIINSSGSGFYLKNNVKRIF